MLSLIRRLSFFILRSNTIFIRDKSQIRFNLIYPLSGGRLSRARSLNPDYFLFIRFNLEIKPSKGEKQGRVLCEKVGQGIGRLFSNTK